MENKVLNFEQRRVLDCVLSGHNVFISGKAGTGKTFMVKYLLKFLKQAMNVAITCTTGMACTLYDNARTLHSFAGLARKLSRLSTI
jgi:ATP-dependent DNA helicase PIF1